MKTKITFVTRAASICGLCILLAGCPKDPNQNSMTFDGAVIQGGGSGGTTGGGGAAGTLPATIPGTPIATFDATPGGFMFSMFDEPGNLAVHNAGTPPLITLDPDQGSPTAGSLKVTAPYSGANQYVDVQSPSFGATNLQNYAGKSLHVRVRVDPGSTFAGQVQPYVDTTAGFVFVGSSINIMPGTDWRDYVVDLDNAVTRNTGYDNTKVILFGVHIGSGGAGANATPVTFHIDSFSVDPPLSADVDAAAEPGSDAAAEAGSDATTDVAIDVATTDALATDTAPSN